MEKQKKYLKNFTNQPHHKTIEVNIDIVEYEEENIHYVYSPALDLIGYGQSQEAARGSWELVLDEYFKYTLDKNTLIKDLQGRGWHIIKDIYTPPDFSWLLNNNYDLIEVYNKYDFQKTSRHITVPALA
jgi:hypothetical protein